MNISAVQFTTAIKNIELEPRAARLQGLVACVLYKHTVHSPCYFGRKPLFPRYTALEARDRITSLSCNPIVECNRPPNANNTLCVSVLLATAVSDFFVCPLCFGICFKQVECALQVTLKISLQSLSEKKIL